MRVIAKSAMRSPVAASINAAAYAVIALFFPPMMIVSGAIIGLAASRFGIEKGTRVLGGAILVFSVAYYLLPTQPGTLLLLFVAWVPLLIFGHVVRISQSQGMTITLCGIFAAVYATLWRIAVPDVTAYWSDWIQDRLATLNEAITDQGGSVTLNVNEATFSAQMHEALLVVVLLYWITTMLLARWWQSALYNPGGFGAEFRQLVIPRVVSPIAAVIAICTLAQVLMVGTDGLPSDLLIVLVVLFAFQGLALLHHRANLLGLAKRWLVGFYILLILMISSVGLILAFVGIADTITDVRRLRNPSKPTD